jgi:hypothetical protein
MKRWKVASLDPFKPQIARKPPAHRVASGQSSL